ncbi:MAG: type II secretion system protein GspG, partial [Halopseudomonas sp.]
AIPTSGDVPRNYRSGGYIDRLQKDPWANEYQYLRPGRDGREYDVYSLVADGRPGGEGANADIGNWNMDQNENR